jgi:integrase
VLHVRQSLRQGPSGLALGVTKTARSVRSLALPSITVDALRRHQRRQATAREKAADMWAVPNLNLVFPTVLGHPVNKRNYRDSLQRATKAAGIPGTWAPYELRHTWVSMCSDAGATDGAIADAAGNSARMIADVYRHPTTPVAQSHMLAMNGLFGGDDIVTNSYCTPIALSPDLAPADNLAKAV